METLALYALKVGACLALFYLFFKLLLSRETLHRFNRLLLLGTILLSFVLPFCVITITREVPAAPAAEFPAWLLTQAGELPGQAPGEAPFDWGRLLGGLYLAGAAAMLLATAVSVLQVQRMVRRGRCEVLPEGWTLVRLPQVQTPFSWWRYIVVPDDACDEGFAQIIEHESAHLRLRHSWDLVLADLAGCMQWFNPAMWLLRRELRAIHEYEADEAVLASGADARQYQLMLIKKAAGKRWYSVANSFNHSNLKNRITMMLQKRSSRWARAKALVAVPLVCVALGAFARTVEVPVEDKGTKKLDWEILEVKKPGKKVTIRVTVTDAAGDLLPGVVMRESGTAHGTVTDPSGRAELTIDEEASVDLLMAGYVTVNLSYRNGTTTLRNRGSMQTIRTTPELAELRVTMQPEVEYHATMQPASVESHPMEVKIVHSTVAEISDPLFLVEGEVIENPDAVDPAQIKSVDVLKDPQTIASYIETHGDKAKNGVVLIHLKSASDDPALQTSAVTTLTTEGSTLKVVSTRTETRIDGELRPLILVDGEVVDDLNAVDSQTIQSIEVLKGDEQAAPYVEKYGEKAKNGVILIRLKSGEKLKSGRIRIHGAEGDAIGLNPDESGVERLLSDARQQLGAFDSDAWKKHSEAMQLVSDYFQSDEWKEKQALMEQFREEFNLAKQHFNRDQEQFDRERERFNRELQQFNEEKRKFEETQE